MTPDVPRPAPRRPRHLRLSRFGELGMRIERSER